MEGDIEDGELIDSDGEINKVEMENTEAPSKSSFASSSLWQGVGGCELGYMKTLTSHIASSRRLPEGLPSSESESDETSDGSDDERLCKKVKLDSKTQKASRTTDAFTMENQHSNGDNGTTNGKGQLRKPHENKIWSSVIQDQILSSDMSGWSGLDQAVESDRNVESYNYVKAKEMNASAPLPPSSVIEVVQEGQSDTVPDISEMETFGTIASNKQGDRALLGNGKNDHITGKPSSKRNSHGELKSSVHSRLGSRSDDGNKHRSHIKVSGSDELSSVVDDLVRILREPDSMKDVFARVVETVGVEAAFKFLHETENVEEAGGLMTLDGRRRRTPGGTYLYLVKNGISKEQQDVIFLNQREESKRLKKVAKSRQKKKVEERCRAMEAALGLNTKTETDSSSTAEEKPDPVKPELQEMEQGEDIDGVDCLAEPDPSVNIELDFA